MALSGFSPAPPLDLPLASVLEQDWDEVCPTSKGDSQPSTSPPGFLPGSSMIEEADLDGSDPGR